MHGLRRYRLSIAFPNQESDPAFAKCTVRHITFRRPNHPQKPTRSFSHSLRKKLKILESGNFLPDRAGTISIYHYHQMLGLACGKNLSSSSAMVSIRIKSRLGVSGNGAKNPYSPYLGETKIKKYRIWLTLRNRHHCSGSVFGSRDQIISREITFNLTKELEVP